MFLFSPDHRDEKQTIPNNTQSVNSYSIFFVLIHAFMFKSLIWKVATILEALSRPHYKLMCSRNEDSTGHQVLSSYNNSFLLLFLLVRNLHLFRTFEGILPIASPIAFQLLPSCFWSSINCLQSSSLNLKFESIHEYVLDPDHHPSKTGYKRCFNFKNKSNRT